MRIITPIRAILATMLVSTSAVAGSARETPRDVLAQIPSTAQVPSTGLNASVINAAAPPDALPLVLKTNQRRSVRVVKEPNKAPRGTAISITEDSRFIYKYSKSVASKSYRPSDKLSGPMPNLFKK